MNKKILYVCQEITPYIPETPLSYNCRYLPQAIQEKGKEIRTFMPRYGVINERRNQLHEVIRLSGMNLTINDIDHPLIIKVASIQSARMQVYFIDNEDFFKRKGISADSKGVEYKDNDERCIFFARGVLETIKKLRWMPDVIDCHGWFSSLVGMYVKNTYANDSMFKNSKIVHSLYKDEFKGTFSDDFVKKLTEEKIDESLLKKLEGETLNYENIMKFAIDFSDGVIEAEEATDPVLAEYAISLGKKFLPYQGDIKTGVDAINDFYENL